MTELKNQFKTIKKNVKPIEEDLIEEEIVMSIAQGEAREIEEIDNALKKIKKGKYGVCENCGRKINKQRLTAIPFVSLCIKCKETEERDEGTQIDRGGYYRIESVDYGGFEKNDEKSKGIKYIEKSDIYNN